MIGGLVTTLALAPSEPLQKTCLQCGRCRRFCPGQALTPERFTWQRCKSYITQKKGDLTAAEAAIVTKNHYIFGCDVCQEVCPHNTAAEPTPLPEFQNDRITRITAEEISHYSNRTFQAAYDDRAWAWRGKKFCCATRRYWQKAPPIATTTITKKNRHEKMAVLFYCAESAAAFCDEIFYKRSIKCAQ